jgi:hypothetical protein
MIIEGMCSTGSSLMTMCTEVGEQTTSGMKFDCEPRKLFREMGSQSCNRA